MTANRDLAVDQLKGLSILAVITLHLLANLNPQIFALPQAYFYLSLNLLLRFCVPAFFLLSGYTLALKYTNQPFALVPFITKRLTQLLPLYLFWGLLTAWFLHLIPWSAYAPVFTLKSWLLGSLDYHFYFIPAIISLYLLFPFIWFLLSRWPKATLALGLSLSLGWYLLIEQGIEKNHGLLTGLTDQDQYRSIFTWLGYFTVGLYVGRLHLLSWLHRQSRILTGLFSLSLLLLLLKGWWQYFHQIDVIILSRFTQLTVFTYALFTVLIVLWFLRDFQLNSHFSKTLTLLGQHSYLIYLSHPLLIRFGFGLWRHQLTLPVTFSALTLLFLGFFFSLYPFRRGVK